MCFKEYVNIIAIYLAYRTFKIRKELPKLIYYLIKQKHLNIKMKENNQEMKAITKEQSGNEKDKEQSTKEENNVGGYASICSLMVSLNN